MTDGDTAGQVRFLELLGRGFEEVDRNARSSPCNGAIRRVARSLSLNELRGLNG